MAGPTEALGPTYISSRSADVILSDIRPIKLNADALRSINVLLDEFLFSILNAARSLTTHQLRVGLLKVLPTALGKEALLEAEMELRAYLERTTTSGASLATDEPGKEFHLQWSFELLRLKCQAYSTLSDSDEDGPAEARLTERMSHTVSGALPPHANLVAPAALYLTAILESVCEHVLSNVGRVAARDSSRTTATVQDLFVALCEDDSIYGLFKTMKVYEKIEDLSKIPKPRRSKSFSRPSDINTSASRGLSSQKRTDNHPPSSLIQSSSMPGRSRISSESSGSMATTIPNGSTSRSSFDKARAMKMFSNNRSSADQAASGPQNNDSQRSHRRSESALSEGTKQTVAAYNIGDQSPTNDQEFDDMMRSGGTMRVSLTPDRLKSMEVYNKEKNERGTRKPVQKTESLTSLKSNQIVPPTPELPRSARNVSASMMEETPGNKIPGQRTRQTSLSNSSPPVTTTATRLRTVSASMPSGEQFPHALRKHVKASTLPSNPPTTYQFRERNMPAQQPHPATGPQARVRNVTRNRESLDLDDVMGISEDDEAPQEVVAKSPVPRPTKYPVSAGARDLIDFLAEGPPDAPDEPSSAGSISKDASRSPDTPKKGGRLQRMISKLTLKDAEQKHLTSSSSAESYSKSSRRPQSGFNQSPLASPLYSKPVPPRPPPIPTSPYSTPSQSSTSLVEPSSRVRRPSNVRTTVPSSWEQGSITPESSKTTITLVKGVQDLPSARVAPPSSKPQSVNGQAKNNQAREEAKPRSSPPRVVKQHIPTTTSSGPKVPPPPLESQSLKTKSIISDQSAIMAALSQHAQEMRRLLTSATNVDECRLLVDMFLAKSGLHFETLDYSSPPLPSTVPQPDPGTEADLENSLVELFLGGAGEEGSKVDGDDQMLSRIDKSVNNQSSASEGSSISLPMSPPDTPDTSHGKTMTAEPVVKAAHTLVRVATT